MALGGGGMWGGLKALPSAEDIRGLLSTPQSLVAWETNVIQTFFFDPSLLVFDWSHY